MIWFTLALLCVLSAAALLFFYNPAQNSFYPRCMFHSLTGLDCPGCGCLRATHQLLHGNFKEAFLLNPLYIFCLPLLTTLIAQQVFRSFTGRPLFKWSMPNSSVWLLAAVILIFTVIRNLPGVNF